MRKLIRREKPVAVIGLGLFPSVVLPICSYGVSTATLIGSERAHPAEVPTRPIFARLRKLMFPRLDYVVCQTTDIARWFEKALRIPTERVVIIPNVVRPAPAGWSPSTFEGKAEAASPLFVAVGRLDWQKGFDFALKAFSMVRKERPKARLVIIGEGPMQDELLSLRAQLQLEDSVEILPPANDLTPTWRQAYALLFTSRFEGFPNVLAEAMAHGVPSVAFACPSGPSDLIDEGRDGFLEAVGDVEAAAERCIRLIDRPSMRDSLGRSAMKVSALYALDRIADLWLALIERRDMDQRVVRLAERRL
jgi:glycosyltransferase involved in cell wall biosynthesis